MDMDKESVFDGMVNPRLNTIDEYNTLMNSIGVSVSKHRLDENFTLLWANDSFYSNTGYSKGEYHRLFKSVRKYYEGYEEDYKKIELALTGALENGEARYCTTCRMPVKDGSFHWIQIVGTITDDYIDGYRVIYSTFQDITDLMEHVEAEQAKIQRELEEALRREKQANRAKSDFLSRMSHDIRTPMNAIAGMTEIAAAHLDNPVRMRDCLKKISLSSQHLLSLINDVLDMSRIESGKMSVSMNPMFLPELTEDIVTIMRPEYEEKELDFSVHLHHVYHEYFYSDALRIRQVFINILSNACKFTPRGGSVTMDVEENAESAPGTAMFTFSFTDTGIGIRPEFLDCIFDVFTREEDSRVDKTEGSGLGMAIAKRIVDLLGGTISVASELGKGSVFTVSLPLKIDNTKRDDVRLPGARILVADDEQCAVEYAVHVLEECGAAADSALSGYEAFSKVEEAHRQGKDYDAVILDWKMPEMDGKQTAGLIRERVGGAPPILMISAYDWSDIEEQVLRMDVSGFLQKPLFRSTLVRSLEQCMKGKTDAARSEKPVIDFSGKTFLVVEDNELNLEIAQEYLVSTGDSEECARNGAQGLDMFMSSPEYHYDLILMDVQMPVMNGYTATRRLRSLDRRDAAGIPILAMTADAFTEDVEMALEAGMNGHMAKPLNMEQLYQVIGGILEKVQKER